MEIYCWLQRQEKKSKKLFRKPDLSETEHRIVILNPAVPYSGDLGFDSWQQADYPTILQTNSETRHDQFLPRRFWFLIRSSPPFSMLHNRCSWEAIVK
jgi:hypothetical protein